MTLSPSLLGAIAISAAGVRPVIQEARLQATTLSAEWIGDLASRWYVICYLKFVVNTLPCRVKQ